MPTLLLIGALLASGGDEDDLRRRARSILAENCFDCHGPEAGHRKAKLRLDVSSGFLAKKGDVTIVTPGDPAASELYARIVAEDPGDRMPPAKSGRKLGAGQVETLRKWIAAGAPWGKHWAFEPPKRPGVPDLSENPIDAFVLKRLEASGLEPSPEADRITLFRRLHLDLLGLPPSMADVERFAEECRAGGMPDKVVAKWVDRLLASPHFGERWGRHWLDLARYADSDGYEDDRTRPDAWRFRDWVVGAVNRDLPFDRFTVEQLAGDLLPDAGYGQRVAVGFHRMAAYNRVAVGKENEEEFRVKYVKEQVNTTAGVWLGLTLGCAECHDHKYDPLTQRDYYRFYAFFNNLERKEIDAPSLPERYARAYAEAKKAHDDARAKAKKAEEALEAFEANVMPGRMVRWARSVDPSAVPPGVAEVLALAPGKRTKRHLDRLTAYFRSTDPDYVRMKAELVKYQSLGNNRPDPPSTQALSFADREEKRKSFIQIRGIFEDPGEEVTPGVPDCLESKSALNTREDLARWITDPRNPLTARVAVNHVWKHLFGRGLVPTPDNFGAQGEPPTHPDLLDWLAVTFVEDGWSRKKLIRRIVLSAAYRQASRRRPEAELKDPTNRWLHRQNRLRVEGEIVRDLGLSVSGLLNPELGGPGIQPALPASLLKRPELRNERLMLPSEGRDQFRRGIYVNVQRTFAYPMLKDFDAVDSSAACPVRDRSTTPQQALTLLNDPVFAECARALGKRIVRECAGDARARAAFGFRLCLARVPKAKELAVVLDVYETHRRGEGEEAAWAAVGRTLLNVDEFITRE